MQQKRVILIGAGNRGVTYTDCMYQHSQKYQIVGVADPNPMRRQYIAEKHGLTDNQCHESWVNILSKPKFADLALICTQDSDHISPALKAIELGYDILLEKPMATNAEDCIAIKEAAEKNGVKVMVCFVLRYSPFFMAIKRLIMDGALGRIINIDHIEGVGNVHQSHSFVRGNWKNSDESCCMILAKSCHDIDILNWLIDSPCKQVQSFGSLSHFTPENKPEGAPERCIDGCPYGNECFYNSKRLYLDDKENVWFRTTSTNTPVNPSDKVVEKALRESEYGKCVYSCNNNVVDHQSVNLLYENGVTATFTMSAFTAGGRSIRIMGTAGELFGNTDDNIINFYSFATRKWTQLKYDEIISKHDITGGHGGGDFGIINELYDYLCDDYHGYSISPISVICDNHLTTLAAEYSRVNDGVTVDIIDFKKKITE